jgi:uncharacterized membrane protein YjgN (DUF898 family)
MNEPIAPRALIASSRIDFTGRRSDFRHLAMRGGALELVTVGFYRFWLATDIRRHLWSNTSVGRDGLEYTGTAKELLIGFLFALAILAPIYLAYFFIGLEAERLKAFLSLPLVLFFYLFTQFAVYRARRYRLTRTVWRGVRFWMAGSGWSYAWRAALWTLFAIVTVGLALPWRQAALERFKMRHTSYGDLQGRFEGTGGQFFKRGWWIWLLMVITVSTSVAIPFAMPFLYAAFKAVEWRWWVSGVRFGDVSFESDMTGGALIGLYWKVVGWSLLLLSGLSAWIGGVLWIAYSSSNVAGTNAQKVTAILEQPSTLIAMALGYIVFILAAWVVMRIYLMRDVWQRVAMSTTVHNLAAADNVVARGHLVGALGEGFADSLDVVGF